jgi:ubiquitin carboxyl-terminal hydrolase L5
MSDSAGWSLTESGKTVPRPHSNRLELTRPSRSPDPGIFTGLLKELGVKGLEVEELYGLEPELLQDLQ